MKINMIIVGLICFNLMSTNLVIKADNNIMPINETENISLNGSINIPTMNLIDENMFDSEGNLIIPEIEIPDDLPDFNVSLRDKYNSALGQLKLQGFDVNNVTTNITHNYSSDIENFFYTKFPDTKLNTEKDVNKLLTEFTNEFDKVYENGKPEELPSKEATLVWNKVEILNSAAKPKGYAEALKEVSKNIGKGNQSLKNEVANKIDSTHSKINPNAKPNKTTTPTVGKPSKPNSSTASKPNMPSVPTGTKPKEPSLKTPQTPNALEVLGNATIGQEATNKVSNTVSGIWDKASNGWDKITDKVSSGWDKLIGKK